MVLLSWRWIEKEGSILNKKLYYLGLIVITTVILSACSKALPSGQADILSTERQETEQVIPATQYQETASEQELGPGGVLEEAFIIPEGNTIKTRIRTPQGYTRVLAQAGSLAEFIREYPLKKDQSPVLLYDGTRKHNQSAHAAVFSLPIEPEDLQQCADSVMRMYAEYFRETGQDEKIAFHFVNGFLAEYVKWREGYRINVNGDDAVWEKTASYDDSYQTFVAYLRMVFAYAGTLSMEAETEQTTLEELEAGDVFLQGGSPGHVVLVLDVCENSEGRKAFLLGQGYMPAQEFHVLKNPGREDDPWYYEEEAGYPFETPEYTFTEGSLKRFTLFD